VEYIWFIFSKLFFAASSALFYAQHVGAEPAG
jgi:hypothetical protein